jgi:hypothetical protein
MYFSQSLMYADPSAIIINRYESKFQLSQIKVLVLRCRKPYYLHSLSQIYLSKHVYYLGIKIGSQVKHPVIDFDLRLFLH